MRYKISKTLYAILNLVNVSLGYSVLGIVKLVDGGLEHRLPEGIGTKKL